MIYRIVRFNYLSRGFLFGLIVFGITACSSSDDSSPSSNTPEPEVEPTSVPGSNPIVAPDADSLVTSVELDATAGGFGAAADDPLNKWAYLNLETGQVQELTDADAESSNAWHVAFKRTNVRLNGGVSGPANVTGGIVNAQPDLYDANDNPLQSAFTDATADSQLLPLQQSSIIEQVQFTVDEDRSAIVGDGVDLAASWWIYNPTERSIAANPRAWYVVRGSEGESYAKFHITDIQQADRQVAIEMYLQGSGKTVFDSSAVLWTAVLGGDGNALCYKFDQRKEVACTPSETNWDMQIEISADGRAWNIWTNGGVRGNGSDGASFGPITSAEQSSYLAGDSVPGFFADSEGGVFKDFSWYAYNLEGNHQIWPNYRVYAIKTADNTVYKLQVLRYYDEVGTSGVITLRYLAW